MDLPADLIPLPTSPWDERPTELPLDVEECRTALWMCRGNITEAAAMLKIRSDRLRRFVRNSPRLSEEVNEAREQLVDMSESVIHDALNDMQDPGRRDSMARFVAASIGKSRGYGSGSSNVNVKMPNTGKLIIEWGDGSSLGDNSDGKLIEGEAKSA